MPTMTRRHGLGALPWTVLGYRKDGRPIHPIAGGAPDDDDVGDDPDGGKDDDKPDDDSDDSDDSDDDKPDDDKPDDEDDDEELGDAGKKALQKERDKNKELRRKLREATKKKDGDPDEAEAKAEEKWKPAFVKTAARSALEKAGLIGKPDRLLRLLDMDDLEVDIDEESGEVSIDGLDDAVAGIRTDYPALFRKRGSSAIDASDRDERRTKREQSATERQAAFLLGR